MKIMPKPKKKYPLQINFAIFPWKVGIGLDISQLDHEHGRMQHRGRALPQP